ncbi:TonB-dependent receptor [Desertivirga arenae]|uniref:TonB-dependent receptor n=1 Tax=Desertivirga arenae TaxID=2810309 RepID=UPI001A9577D2|nr:TonB-dependent receptor [Pedobacter sp. SYSU D00823]
MKYWVLTIVTLVSVVVQASAQQFDCRLKIEGSVRDSLSGLPVHGVLISVITANRTAITDEHGHFSINKICEGPVILVVNTPGFRPYKKVFSRVSEQSVSLLLQKAELKLEEVHITAGKPFSGTVNIAGSITANQLEQSRGGTLADALRSVPGVSTLQTGSSIAKPVVQGLHSNRLLILNNGIRQEGQQWGMEHGPEIDPFIAQSITVIKGAEGVRYGPEAIAGVILVKPAALPKQFGIAGTLNLAGSSNGLGGAASGALEGASKGMPGFAWRFQTSGRTSGNIKTADYYLNNTGLRELNFSGGLGYSRKKLETDLYFSHFQSEIGIFRGSHIGNLEDLQAALANGRPFDEGSFTYSIDAPRQKVAHNLLKLESHFHLSSKSHVDLVYGLQQNKRQEYDIRRGGRSGIPSLDLTLTTQTLDISLENDNGSHWKQIVGVNGILQVNNNVPGTLATPLIPNYDSYNAGLFYIGRYSKSNYQLEGGLRYDYKYLDALGYDRNQDLYGGTRKFNNVSANAGAVLYLTNQWTIRSNLASAWRPPVVSELFSNGLHHGSAAVEIGDKDLASEKSYKWINAIEFHGDNLNFDFSAYWNRINNYIYLQPSLELYESIRGVFPTYYYKQTHAQLLGADLGLSFDLSSHLKYGLKGAIVRAKDVRNDIYLPWIPSDRIENSISFHWSDRGKETANYVTLNHLYVARQNRYEEGSDFTSPPPSYHLLGLQAGTSFFLGKKSLGLNASVNNIANTFYKDYMNRFRYYAHDQGRNLTLRATLKF